MANSHSMFFDILQTRGHELTLLQAESPELSLKKFGDYLYDNIVFMAPSVDDLNTISFDDILEFASNGGNILIAVDGQMSNAVREFAESCGVEFDARGSAVIDHFQNNAQADPRYRKSIEATASRGLSAVFTFPTPLISCSLQGLGVLSSTSLQSKAVLGAYAAAKSPAPVLFRGIGHAIDDSNILAVKVLRGNPSTYSAVPSKPVDDYPENTGADTLLVTALQARNNARVVVSGSLDLFSNSFFRAKQSNGDLVGNELFCAELSKWAFGEAGVLRFRDIVHHKVRRVTLGLGFFITLFVPWSFLIVPASSFLSSMAVPQTSFFTKRRDPTFRSPCTPTRKSPETLSCTVSKTILCTA